MNQPSTPVPALRVALVSPVYPPDTGWGGIGTYMVQIARGLAGRGHQVTVLCGCRERTGVWEEHGVRVVRRIQHWATGGEIRSREIADLLDEEIAREKIEVVEFAEYGGDGAVFQRRHPEFPVVVKLHCPTRLCAIGEAPPWQQAFRRRYLAASPRAVDLLERESASRAHVLVSPSRWLMATVRDLDWRLPERCRVVPNPYATQLPGKSIRQPAAGGPRVLVLGRLARIKGADLYPAIFRAVWRRNPAVAFELVGQDTPRTTTESWQEYVTRKCPAPQRARLVFRQGLPSAEVPAVLARHEVALFASRFESAPYAQIECMEAGLACVVGSRGGAQELGEHEVSVLNTPRDPDQIALHVIRVLNDQLLRTKLATEAHRRVQTAFDPGKIAEQMERIYAEAGAVRLESRALESRGALPLPAPEGTLEPTLQP